MAEAKVFRFEVWDHSIGDNVWAPRMATLETIERVHGAPDLSTEMLVDEALLDGSGYHQKKPTPEGG